MRNFPPSPTLPIAAFQATRTGMFVGLGVGLGVSYVLLEHGKALLQLFLGDNSAGERHTGIKVQAATSKGAAFLLTWDST